MARHDDTLQLADWRRRAAELYARVRATEEPLEAWWIWREGRDRLFRGHPQTPLDPDVREDFAGLAYFDYDPALRFLVEVGPAAGAETEIVELGADGTIRLEPAGRTLGLASDLGGELTLYWVAGYGGGLFLPFTDATSGRGTFGGGRYVLDGIKGADLGSAAGRLVVDFNFAYNPSCAYSPAWTCPLAPPGNRLGAAIEAGERMPATA